MTEPVTIDGRDYDPADEAAFSAAMTARAVTRTPMPGGDAVWLSAEARVVGLRRADGTLLIRRETS